MPTRLRWPVRAALALASFPAHLVAGGTCVDYSDRISWRGHIPAQTTVASLALIGHYAFTSEGVFDVSNAADPVRVETSRTALRAVRDVHGSLAYATPADSIVALDVGDPLAPIQLAAVPLPGRVVQLAAGDGYACVELAGLGGVRICQLVREETRFIVRLLVDWNPRALAAEGRRAYILDGAGLLHIFDLTAFHAPYEIGWLRGHLGTSIDVEAGLLAMSTEFGTALVDVHDPAAPAFLGYVDPEGGGSVRRSGDLVASIGYRGLRVVDVADPRAPRFLGQFDLVGFLYLEIAVGGDRILAAYDFYRDYRHLPPPPGIHVFDFGPAEAIQPLAVVPVAGTAWSPLGVGVAGDRAYMVDAARFQVVDLAAPATPVVRGRIALRLGGPVTVAVQGTRAYLGANETAESAGGLHLVDIQDPDAPRLLGSLAGNIRALAVGGDHAFVTNETGLHVIDVSDEAAPVEVGSLALPYAYGVVVHEQQVIVATLYGLRIVDVSQPDHPVLVHEIPGAATALAIDDRFLYVAHPLSLGILPLDDLGGAEVGSYPVLFDVGRIVAAPPTVYLAVQGDGYYSSCSMIHALDVLDPRHPRLLGVVDPDGIRSLDATGDLLLVGGDGLEIYPAPCAVATPVLLCEVAARTEGGAIHLRWQVSGADGSMEFEVSRSQGESPFEELAHLSAREYWDRDIRDGATYTYRVVATLDDGTRVTSTPVQATAGALRFALAPAWPNPAAGNISLRFTLPVPGAVRLDIFDVAGRRVRRLFEGRSPAGQTQVHWDGRTDAGRAAGRGTYVARLTSAHGTRASRLILTSPGRGSSD